MTYMGSKSRIGKEIYSIMKQYRKQDQVWVEPFVGGGNMIQYVDGKRIGLDINKYTINGMLSIRDSVDSLPKNNKEFTKDDYERIKKEYKQDIPHMYPYYGYISFAFSFGGKFFDSWATNSKGTDYVFQQHKSAIKKSKLIQGVDFYNISYDNYIYPNNSIIYCDPPYKNTTSYKNQSLFNHDKFYEWCRVMIENGHTLFVSEYSAPDDFICIWKKEVSNGLSNSKKPIEKLFIHNSQYKKEQCVLF